MDAESKLISGLLCHVGKTLRGKNVCKKCPYFIKNAEKCHGNLAFDALRYIFANEYSKHILDGLTDIREIAIGKPPCGLSENEKEGEA